ncbi:MAG TPA: DUF1631 domain-containing protein [Pseudoxanthomonas sp.]
MSNNFQQGSAVTSMPATPPVQPSAAPATIASASSLPPRVRRILDVFFTRASADLGNRINLMLVDFEHQLFKQAERARNNAQQAEQFANLHALRANRSDLFPLFMAALETEVANVRQPRSDLLPESGRKQVESRTMTLVEHDDIDQDIVLNEIARHQELRAQTALYLMGQRFGVLAGSPAFDAAQLPVGPQALCRILRATTAALRIDPPSQLLLYKSFDQKALADYGEWIEELNALLSKEGVLPGLVFMPRRARNDLGSIASRKAANSPLGALDASRPMTGWHGEPLSPTWSFGLDVGPASAQEHRRAAMPDGRVVAGGDAATFATLQQLLSERRPAPSADVLGSGLRSGMIGIGRPLSTHDVLSTLRSLQSMPVPVRPGLPPRTMMNLQEALLTQVREQYGPEATLVQEDADTFELLDLLYNEIEREVQHDTQAVEWLVRLQVPAAQAALHDREFFLRPQHPARELLNSVAESGAVWLGEDDADPQLARKLQQAVDRVVTDYQGDDRVFEEVNSEVQAHFDAMARKAEVTERRHMEAARGKDRLEVAKHRASEAIESALQGRTPHKFVQALLDQAWADVLTLTLLRNGDDSEEWKEQQKITERIVAATSTEADPGVVGDAELTPHIESALVQVGYHGDEAAAIARRLSNANSSEETVSNTELSVRLKARGEFGEQAVAKKAPPPARTSKEQKCHEYLRTLPFGTWFEFVQNQQGDVIRQRLSWYSPITDNALFVNQRGQRIGEQSLDSLARLMAREQVHVVTEGKSRLIDRAWQATVGTLRNFAGGGPATAIGEASA